jgi:hypothetical protein
VARSNINRHKYPCYNDRWTDDEDEWLLEFLKDKPRTPQGRFKRRVWEKAALKLKRPPDAIAQRYGKLKINGVQIKVNEAVCPEVSLYEIEPVIIPINEIKEEPAIVIEKPVNPIEFLSQITQHVQAMEDKIKQLEEENQQLKALNETNALQTSQIEQLNEKLSQTATEFYELKSKYDTLTEEYDSIMGVIAKAKELAATKRSANQGLKVVS